MINVSRVILDPRFNQAFTINRKEGQWVNGNFIQEDIPLAFSGVIKPASVQDIEMIPEGDRVGGEVAVFTTKPLTLNDEILWNGDKYKAYSLGTYQDYGYYKMIAIRKKGY